MKKLIYGVPGTDAWMQQWQDNPDSQEQLARHAREINELASKLTDATANRIAKNTKSIPRVRKTYLRAVAAARRTQDPDLINILNAPIRGKGEKKMARKQETKKKAEENLELIKIREELTATREEITYLVAAVEKLQTLIADTDTKRKTTNKTDKKTSSKKTDKKTDKKNKKETAPATDGTINKLLKKLQAAKDSGDKGEARKIRIQLRRAGYSLRKRNK